MSSVKFVVVPNLGFVKCIGDKSVGVARCAPSDSFDEAKGREIARKRMVLNRIKKEIKQADFELQYLSDVSEAIEDRIDKLFDANTTRYERAMKLEQELDELVQS